MYITKTIGAIYLIEVYTMTRKTSILLLIKYISHKVEIDLVEIIQYV